MLIRLIASDMDGTLLDEHSEVPPETYDLILACARRACTSLHPRGAASTGCASSSRP